MSEIRIASRYAKSLIELAQEKGVLEQVNEDMNMFARTLDQNRELKLLMRNPIVKSDKKLAVINALFKGKVNEMTLAFFKIVAQKGRESVLEFIAPEFTKQYNLYKGITTASVTTAMPLTEELRNELGQRLVAQTGQKVELEEKIDPSLIGGFVLRVGDQQIDSSVKYNLSKLRNKFKDNPYINKL
ncbi:ATP synthase F1 subunit delta [Pontibacter sp. JH31]|uniref:ATP synthase subunit delta n=1 Tax=Pontibacter aquaedesilientis TaxID=2766980 RepID=A0ABR7XG44_9BACT|nr:ATP synthase F1 subunit delta [Pontibacter aquaedesilientis]MBD1397251.1 ATP synthase F1 subunit delta [Pontibacter aquaedesilientis]